MSVKGILVINLGTPDSYQPRDVKRYLNEFLCDEKVILLPFLLRQFLVKALIVPFRGKKSAKAYETIWTTQGSPLKVLTQSLCDRLQLTLDKEQFNTNEKSIVVMAMRYQNPSIQEGIKKLMAHGCTHIDIIPLFPHNATSSYGTAVSYALKNIAQYWNTPSLRVLGAYYDKSFFINAYAKRVLEHVDIQSIDCLLMSYHGLPVNHLVKSGCTKVTECQSHSCPPLTKDNFCYKSQCHQTSRVLAQALGLSSDKYQVSFQSRLGKTPWIEPFTDEILVSLRKKGVKRLAVVCPAFVIDCLETIEEIGMNLKETWLSLEGESFTLVPCINDSEVFISGLIDWIRS